MASQARACFTPASVGTEISCGEFFAAFSSCDARDSSKSGFVLSSAIAINDEH